MSSFMDGVFDKSIPGLQKTLDLAWRRNQAITSNVANSETPQYRAMDVDFAGELEKAFDGKSDAVLKKTHNGHLDLQSTSNAHLVADYSGATRADGNNVDIDIQMGKMAYNSGKYSITASLVRKKLQMMRMAIRQSMR